MWYLELIYLNKMKEILFFKNKTHAIDYVHRELIYQHIEYYENIINPDYDGSFDYPFENDNILMIC